MLLPIIIFFVAILTLLHVIGKIAERKNPRRNLPQQTQDTDILSFTDSKRYAWTWMQAAGELGFAYVRPTEEQPFPSFAGDSGEFRISVTGKPVSGEGIETAYCITFPKSAGLGLVLTCEKHRFPLGISGIYDPAVFTQDPDTASFYLAVQKPEIFRMHYLPACEAFLKKNKNIFSDFKLTDSSFEFFFPGLEDHTERLVRYTKELMEAGTFFSSLAKYAAAQPIPASEHVSEEKYIEPVVSLKPKLIKKPAAEPVKNDISLRKEVLLSKLWHSSFPGSEERKYFEDQCKGKTIEWDGLLRSSYEYTTDFVFGGKGGCKAVIELLELSQGSSMFKIKVKAVVSFPRETYPQLRNAFGKKVCFSGTLLKFEPLTKELFVSQGSLLKLSE